MESMDSWRLDKIALWGVQVLDVVLVVNYSVVCRVKNGTWCLMCNLDSKT